MEFQNSYKRLDNLCKDLLRSDSGITSYIKEMEQIQAYSGRIPDWESVYQKLEYYRHIRNQIAHENWANEESLCNDNDAFWLQEFYQKILRQTDPLSQYQRLMKKTMEQNRNRPAATSKKIPVYDSPQKRQHGSSSIVIFAIIVVLVLCVLTLGIGGYFLFKLISV